MNNILEDFLSLFSIFSNNDNKQKRYYRTNKPRKKATPRLELVLKRTYYTNKSTIGELLVDKQFECYILEDYDRLSKGLVKKDGETAIPRGTYDIDITYSPKFKTKLPVLKNVPNFRGIRIHPGNTPQDTEGCLLPGQDYGPNRVIRSRRAFNALFKKLQEAKSKGKRIIIKVT